MKLKKLKRKIDRLEKRLREGPQKLAKLKHRLEQAESAKALKAARKSAARAVGNRKSGKRSAPAKQKLTMVSGDEKPSASGKPKKKLNLSQEHRAQLSAAMRARWAAKKAGEANSSISTDRNSAKASSSKPPENRIDGM